MKDRFYVKYEWLHLLRSLNGENFKGIVNAICEYEEKGQTDYTPNEGTQVVWKMVLKELKRGRQNQQNGKCGGNPKLKAGNKKSERSEIDPTLFEIFWGEYPKRVGKTYARQCFYKLKPTREMLEKMISAIREQKNGEQWKSENGKFIPNPATWLNQGRWMDEVHGAEGNEFKEMKIGIRL